MNRALAFVLVLIGVAASSSCAGLRSYAGAPTPPGARGCPESLLVSGALRPMWMRCDRQTVFEAPTPDVMLADDRGVVMAGTPRIRLLAIEGFPPLREDAGYVAAFDARGVPTMLFPAPEREMGGPVVLGPDEIAFRGEGWARPTGMPRFPRVAPNEAAWDAQFPERLLPYLFPAGPGGRVVGNSNALGVLLACALDGNGRVLIASHGAHAWSKDDTVPMAIVDPAGRVVTKRPQLFRRLSAVAGLPLGGFVLAGIVGTEIELVMIDSEGRERNRSTVPMGAPLCDSRRETPCVMHLAIDASALFVILRAASGDVVVVRVRGAERAEMRVSIAPELLRRLWPMRVATDGRGGAYAIGDFQVTDGGGSTMTATFLARFAPY